LNLQSSDYEPDEATVPLPCYNWYRSLQMGGAKNRGESLFYVKLFQSIYLLFPLKKVSKIFLKGDRVKPFTLAP
jgi:hypothetical protein